MIPIRHPRGTLLVYAADADGIEIVGPEMRPEYERFFAEATARA